MATNREKTINKGSVEIEGKGEANGEEGMGNHWGNVGDEERRREV